MRQPVEHVHTNARGERVRILGWPVEGAKTAVFVHHGLGEHIGRYQTFADHLEGMAIWGYDAQGHGEYTERRGHAEGLGGLAADLYGMLPVLLELSGAERVVLAGHSMGAAVVLTYLTKFGAQDAIAGIVLSASPVSVDLDLGQKIKIAVGRVLARFAPSATLASGLHQDGISSVAAQVERYRRDPLVHDRISLELGRSIIDDVDDLTELAAKIDLPTLLLHGTQDPIAACRGSKALVGRIEGSQLELFEGARHEIHHETPAHVERYFGLVGSFVQTHLGSGAPN